MGLLLPSRVPIHHYQRHLYNVSLLYVRFLLNKCAATLKENKTNVGHLLAERLVKYM